MLDLLNNENERLSLVEKIFKTKNEKNKISINNDIKDFGDFTNKKNKYVKVLKVVMLIKVI